MNDYEKTQAPMVEKLISRIIYKGHVVLNNKPTKIPKNPNEKPSCIDLIFTNSPELVINHNTITDTFSDHAMVTMTRRSKPLQNNKNMINLRSFKDFNPIVFR